MLFVTFRVVSKIYWRLENSKSLSLLLYKLSKFHLTSQFENFVETHIIFAEFPQNVHLMKLGEITVSNPWVNPTKWSNTP